MLTFHVFCSNNKLIWSQNCITVRFMQKALITYIKDKLNKVTQSSLPQLLYQNLYLQSGASNSFGVAAAVKLTSCIYD